MTTALQHRYLPRGAARRLLGARDGEILLSGPAGTGKSMACLYKLHRIALKYPGCRLLIVRKTASSLTSTALVTYKEKIAKEALDAGIVSYFGGSGSRPAQYEYENGSVIVIGGMDKPTKIMSSEYDVIFVQEAIELTVEDWEALTTRLRNGVVPYNQLIADTNPERNTHWLYKRALQGDVLLMESRHEDNPMLFTDDQQLTPAGEVYIGRLDKLTGVRKQRLRYGRWVSAEGVIYESWDPDAHMIPKRRIPKDWPRYWSMDFGMTNPFVCQFWAENPDGDLILYREIYHTKRTIKEHCEMIAKLIYKAPRKDNEGVWYGDWLEPFPQAVIADYAGAEERANFVLNMGFSTTAAKKKIKEGIELVETRLKERRLYIMRDALAHPPDPELVKAAKPTCTAEEMGGYVWATPQPGKPPKEEPQPGDDHGMDAMRYLVSHKDMGARVNVRWL